MKPDADLNDSAPLHQAHQRPRTQHPISSGTATAPPASIPIPSHFVSSDSNSERNEPASVPNHQPPRRPRTQSPTASATTTTTASQRPDPPSATAPTGTNFTAPLAAQPAPIRSLNQRKMTYMPKMCVLNSGLTYCRKACRRAIRIPGSNPGMRKAADP